MCDLMLALVETLHHLLVMVYGVVLQYKSFSGALRVTLSMESVALFMSLMMHI